MDHLFKVSLMVYDTQRVGGLSICGWGDVILLSGFKANVALVVDGHFIFCSEDRGYISMAQ
jgi:hypothetical protein